MIQTIVYILICINVVTFLVYGIDKWKAKHGSWRISEATLLILAVIGGSISATIRNFAASNEKKDEKNSIIFVIRAVAGRLWQPATDTQRIGVRVRHYRR